MGWSIGAAGSGSGRRHGDDQNMRGLAGYGLGAGPTGCDLRHKEIHPRPCCRKQRDLTRLDSIGKHWDPGWLGSLQNQLAQQDQYVDLGAYQYST